MEFQDSIKSKVGLVSNVIFFFNWLLHHNFGVYNFGVKLKLRNCVFKCDWLLYIWYCICFPEKYFKFYKENYSALNWIKSYLFSEGKKEHLNPKELLS